MPVGELVYANLIDSRVYDAEGAEGPSGIYLVALPGRTFPFVAYRAWKVPTGYVREEFRLIAPSGRLAFRWGPEVRRMVGSMDLTVEADVVTEAVFEEAGTYIASFILEEEVIGEVDVPVYLQAAASQLPKAIEDGLKRSDVIWVGTEENGRPHMVPAWFVYRQGRIYLLSRTEPAPDEQTIPGRPDADDVVVITRRKGRDTSLDRFHAAVRVLAPGPEFEQAAALLADRRRDRHGPPADAIKRWRDTCVIAELTPIVAG
jgi:hypothetical protein